MIKVAIIGTSHVMALKQAAAELDLHSMGFDVAFFGMRYPDHGYCRVDFKARRYELKPGVDKIEPEVYKIAKAINGARHFDFGDADHLIFNGNEIAQSRILQVMTNFRVDGYRDTRREELPLLSHRAMVDFMTAVSDVRMPSKVWSRLGKEVLPMTHLAPPTVSENVLTDPKSKHHIWKLTTNTDVDVARVLDDYRAIHSDMLSNRHIKFLRQPAETLNEFGLTKAEYSVGAIELGSGSEFTYQDHVHMNTEYGKKTLLHVLSKL